MSHGSSDMHGHGGEDTFQPHVPPIGLYAANYIFLVVMLAVTFAVSRIDLGDWNIVVAVVISVIKTAAVATIFMGLKYSSKLTRVWAIVGVFWLFLLFGIMGDYITREWVHLKVGW